MPAPVIRVSTAALAVMLGLLDAPGASAQRPNDELTWGRRAVASMAAQDFDAAVAARPFGGCAGRCARSEILEVYQQALTWIGTASDSGAVLRAAARRRPS